MRDHGGVGMREGRQAMWIGSDESLSDSLVGKETGHMTPDITGCSRNGD